MASERELPVKHIAIFAIRSVSFFSAHILSAVTEPNQGLKLRSGKDFPSHAHIPKRIKTRKHTQSHPLFPRLLIANKNMQYIQVFYTLFFFNLLVCQHEIFNHACPFPICTLGLPLPSSNAQLKVMFNI